MPQSEQERAKVARQRGKEAASKLTSEIERKRPGYRREFIALQGDVEASQGYGASTREERRQARARKSPFNGKKK